MLSAIFGFVRLVTCPVGCWFHVAPPVSEIKGKVVGFSRAGTGAKRKRGATLIFALLSLVAAPICSVTLGDISRAVTSSYYGVKEKTD